MNPAKHWREMATATLVIALTGYLACVDERDVDPDIDSLRDSLALEPTWVAGLPDGERDRLESRFEKEALRQADGEESAELAAEVELTAPLTPRETISRLDDTRAADELEPLLVAWHVRDQSDEPLATACPLRDSDLSDPIFTANEWAQSWTVEDEFDRPLAAGQTEEDALRARLPLFARWLERCQDGLGEQDRGSLTVRRAPGAPTLLAYWPQAGRLYINPVALLLWNPPPPLRTVGQGLARWPLGDCVGDLLDHCAGSRTAPDGSSCNEANENPTAWCLNALNAAEGASLRSCVRQRSGFDPDCELPSPDAPLRSYDTFLDTPGCLAALQACMERPDTRFTPDPEPERDDSYEDSSTAGDCAADCFTELGPECAEIACDGCADSGSSGCEGDGAGDACSGCEGDTY